MYRMDAVEVCADPRHFLLILTVILNNAVCSAHGFPSLQCAKDKHVPALDKPMLSLMGVCWHDIRTTLGGSLRTTNPCLQQGAYIRLVNEYL